MRTHTPNATLANTHHTHPYTISDSVCVSGSVSLSLWNITKNAISNHQRTLLPFKLLALPEKERERELQCHCHDSHNYLFRATIVPLLQENKSGPIPPPGVEHIGYYNDNLMFFKPRQWRRRRHCCPATSMWWQIRNHERRTSEGTYHEKHLQTW